MIETQFLMKFVTMFGDPRKQNNNKKGAKSWNISFSYPNASTISGKIKRQDLFASMSAFGVASNDIPIEGVALLLTYVPNFSV